MSTKNTTNISKKVSDSADLSRGKRLETFLEKRFPQKSWLARSKELGFIDNTVIGWRKGREISGRGLARLHELGCDLYWLLTGNAASKQITPAIPTGVEVNNITEVFSIAGTIHKAVADLVLSVAQGEVQADDAYQAVAEALEKVLQIHGTQKKVDKQAYKNADRNDTGTA